jgi:hypothetical protein
LNLSWKNVDKRRLPGGGALASRSSGLHNMLDKFNLNWIAPRHGQKVWDHHATKETWLSDFVFRRSSKEMSHSSASAIRRTMGRSWTLDQSNVEIDLLRYSLTGA